MSDDLRDKINDPLNRPVVEKVANEVNMARATERAILLGKEITLMLEKEHPVTRALVARVLAQTTRMRFPKVWEMLQKLGL